MIHPEKAILEIRSGIFQALAEALHEPPEWLALPGIEWPLTAALMKLAATVTAAQALVNTLVNIEPASLAWRQKRYAALFGGSGRPRFWPYESMHCSGRLLTAETAAVENYYRVAGLQIAGAELPDHASIELAFLAHLIRLQIEEPDKAHQWGLLERRFIRDHAGRWLPAFGQALADSGDLVYAPLGRLLTRILSQSFFSPSSSNSKKRAKVPFISNEATCSLCGFCVQACPSHALAIRETQQETILYLCPAACNGCHKCEHVCPTKTLQCGQANCEQNPQWQYLVRSPRLSCPGCGQATVSQAEMDYVTQQIGRLAWLATCLDCRSQKMESMPWVSQRTS